jgi:hypothetical protein
VLPPRFLRHCDEQTVVGVRAVLEAIAAMPEPTASFARYGVIGAPLQAGRIAAAQTLSQVAKAGGIAVSPHIVPQCSLHALASAVSVALGNARAERSARAAAPRRSPKDCSRPCRSCAPPAATACGSCSPSGTRSRVLDDAGAPTNDPLCRAVAMAIGRTLPPTRRRHALTRRSRLAGTARSRRKPAGLGARHLRVGAWMCAAGGGAIASWVHECPWGAEIRISFPRAAWARGRRCGPSPGGRRPDGAAASSCVPTRDDAAVISGLGRIAARQLRSPTSPKACSPAVRECVEIDPAGAGARRGPPVRGARSMSILEPTGACRLAAGEFRRASAGSSSSAWRPLATRLQRRRLAEVPSPAADRHRARDRRRALKAWELDFLAGGKRVFAPQREETLVQRLARSARDRRPGRDVAAACASSGYAMALGRTWLDRAGSMPASWAAAIS